MGAFLSRTFMLISNLFNANMFKQIAEQKIKLFAKKNKDNLVSLRL